MTPEHLFARSAPQSPSYGLDDRVQLGCSVEDAALFAQGLPDREYSAFRYRWAGDDTCRLRLLGALFRFAIEQADIERWPERLDGRKYLKRLCSLVIFSDRFPDKIRRFGLLPALSGMSVTSWEAHGAPIFRVLMAEYERWMKTARDHIQARIEMEGGYV